MAIKESTAGRGCEKEGAAREDDGSTRWETVQVRDRALLGRDSNAVDFSLACFCRGFLKNQNYSIIPLPNQIGLLLQQT